jgi:hypothetical protein
MEVNQIKLGCIISINRGKVNRAGAQGYGDLHNRAKANELRAWSFDSIDAMKDFLVFCDSNSGARH